MSQEGNGQCQLTFESDELLIEVKETLPLHIWLYIMMEPITPAHLLTDTIRLHVHGLLDPHSVLEQDADFVVSAW